MFDDIVCLVGEVMIGLTLTIMLMLSYSIASYNDVTFPDDVFIMEEPEVEPSILDNMAVAVLPGE